MSDNAKKLEEQLRLAQQEINELLGTLSKLIKPFTELRRVLSFMDRVKVATDDQKIAVGSDAWEWLEAAARAIVAPSSESTAQHQHVSYVPEMGEAAAAYMRECCPNTEFLPVGFSWNVCFNRMLAATSLAPLASEYEFVQNVPDHCDRIVWRNTYYHLPLRAATPVAGEDAAPIQPTSPLTFRDTSRGFRVAHFFDSYDVACSIQKSSIATEDCIWLGCDNAAPRRLVKGIGWELIPMPDEYTANTRMHLTREQVAALLPALVTFVSTGELPEPTRTAEDVAK
jgi:hypothetical protein